MRKIKKRPSKTLVKIRNIFIKSAPLATAFLTYILLTLGLYGIFTAGGNKASQSPLELKYVNDWILTSVLALTILVAVIYVVRVLKKERMSIYTHYLGTFTTSMIIANLIGVLMIDVSKKVTPAVVTSMITRTKIYNYIVVAICLVGVVWGVYETRAMLKKTNWWALAVCVPYFAVLYSVTDTLYGLNELTGYSDYSRSTVAKMLNSMSNGDINLMNQSLYDNLTINIIAMVVLVGGVIVGIVYQKTRKKTKQANQKAFGKKQ